MASAFDLLEKRASELGEAGIQAAFDRLDAGEPIDADTTLGLGWHLWGTLRMEAAESFFAAALQVLQEQRDQDDEEMRQVTLALAEIRGGLDRDAEARAGFEAVVASAPRSPTLAVARARAGLAHFDHQAGDFAAAAAQIEAAIREQESVRPNLAEALKSGVLGGRILLAVGRHEVALDALERGRKALGPEPSPTPPAVLLHIYLTVALLRHGLGGEAEVRFEEAMRIAAEAPASPSLSSALNEGTSVLADVNASPFALRTAEGALATEEALHPGERPHPTLEQNLGKALAEMNRLDEALGHYRAALASDPAPPTRAAILSNLGELHRERGEFAAALACLTEADELQRRIDPRSREAARKRNNLANVYEALGLDLMAYVARSEAVELHEEADAAVGRPSANTANSLDGLAKTLRALGHEEKARELYRRRLEIWEELAPLSEETATGHCHYAYALRAADPALARTEAETAVRMFRSLAVRSSDAADAFDLLGQLELEAGSFDAAEALFTEALAIRRDTGIDPGHLAISWGRLGALAGERGETELAIERLEMAVSAVEVSRRAAGEGELGMHSFGRSQGEYQDLIAALFEAGSEAHHVRAFAVAEASRSRGLLEQLSRPSPVPSPELRELEDREATAREAIHAAEQAAADGASLAELALEVGRAEEAVHGARARIPGPSADPESRAVPLELEAVRSLLDRRTLLLEYDATGADTFVWAVRADDFAMAPLGMDGAELDAAVRWVVGGYAAGGRATGPRRQALADAVLGPIPERLWEGVERVVVVPDGPLQALPFEALPVGAEEALIDRAAVAVAPSASVLAILETRERAAIDDAVVLAVGDPAPPGLASLPGARREAEAVAAKFPGRATTLIGEAATRAAALAVAGDADLIHLATHGSVDDEAPEQSYLMFRDGPLRSYELRRTPLGAGLVVCSACESGLGRNFPGEGLLGLSRGFLGAGARCVIATLWQVADDATEQLMVSFYELLSTGKAPIDALREAKLRLREDYPEPYYWSSFAAVGAAT